MLTCSGSSTAAAAASFGRVRGVSNFNGF